MTLIVVRIILIVLFLSVIYVVFSSKKRIIKAEAGGIKNASGVKSKNTYSIWEYLFDRDSKAIIPAKDIIPFEVERGCMEYVGIKDGDIMYARKTKSASDIKKYNIILLKVQNNDGKTVYKIRMVDDIIKKEGKEVEFRTFYFINEEGVFYKKISTHNHKYSQVMGIVCFKKTFTDTVAEVA